MDREQFKRLIEMATEAMTNTRPLLGPAHTGDARTTILEHEARHRAIIAAKEELAKWPTEDEIDETPRIPLEEAGKTS